MRPLPDIEASLRATQESARLGVISCSREIQALVYALSPEGLQEAAARKLRTTLVRGESAEGALGRAAAFVRAATDRFLATPSQTSNGSPEASR